MMYIGVLMKSGRESVKNRMECITSRTNRWVKLAAQLRKKKYRDKYDMFIMEGIRSAEDLIAQDIRDVICLISVEDHRMMRMGNIISHGKDLHWLFLQVTFDILEDIENTEHGQGIVLLVKKKKTDVQELYQMKNRFYILLDSIQDPGNLGTLIRTAAAAGCGGIILTEGCVDPYNEKTVRSSMGSILRIPIYTKLSVSMIKMIKEKTKLPLIAATLQNAISYDEIDSIESGIFVFGNEGNGVSDDILNLTDFNLFIPLAHSVESLNVSAAAAIILFKYVNKVKDKKKCGKEI